MRGLNVHYLMPMYTYISVTSVPLRVMKTMANTYENEDVKNERKQLDLRFHSSNIKFVHSIFGGNVGLKKTFQLFLTFNRPKRTTETLKFCE